MHPMLPFRIDNYDHHRSMRSMLSTQFCAYADSEAVAFLDDLADGAAGLVQTASLLADDLFQAYGIAEAPPITRSGEIRESAWAPDLRPRILRWATDHDVPVLTP